MLRQCSRIPHLKLCRRSAAVIFSIALLASGQSSTMTATYAGQFIMEVRYTDSPACACVCVSTSRGLCMLSVCRFSGLHRDALHPVDPGSHHATDCHRAGVAGGYPHGGTRRQQPYRVISGTWICILEQKGGHVVWTNLPALCCRPAGGAIDAAPLQLGPASQVHKLCSGYGLLCELCPGEMLMSPKKNQSCPDFFF